MKDLYTVTLDAKQIASALENYVLDRSPDNQLVARAQGIDGGMKIYVRVSTKRASPKRDKAPA